MVQALTEAGEARFRRHSRRWQREVASVGAEEVLYRGLMEALGYSANRVPFRKLALLLPYAGLHRVWQSLPPLQRLPALQTLLLAAAGLCRYQGETPAQLQPQEWRLSGLRPSNRPERRLRGMAVLLHYLGPTGLLRGLQHLCETGRPQDLEMALTAPGERGVALIGRARARDMAVNVVLPFFHALGTAQESGELAAHALRLYRAFPTLQPNSLTETLASRLFAGEPTPGLRARELQGMLHLHQERCVYLRCAACPLAAMP